MPYSDFLYTKDYVIKNTEMKFLNKLQELKDKGDQNNIDVIIAADTIISIDE